MTAITSSKITEELLAACYLDATRKGGLIEFTRDVRGEDGKESGKYSIKQTDLDTLFSKSVWNEQKTGSGHRKLKHIITGIVIEYADHKKEIDSGAAKTILEQVQKHLNILCNEVFCYTTGNWKEEPDYSAVLLRLEKSLKEKPETKKSS